MWHHEKPYGAYSPDSLLQSLDDIPREKSKKQIALHPFDPNIADSLELISVGLSPYVTRNILRYRKVGGVFRRPEDLARIYGLHDTVFTRVKPYIMIPTTDYSKSNTSHIIDYDTIRREHPYADYMRAKYKPGKFVDLNMADTTELMKIPGIGPMRARRIVEYRHKLGGYHSIAQVHEAYDLPEHLGDWVHISVPTVKKLHIIRCRFLNFAITPILLFIKQKLS